jgi:hypothetical protein
MAVSQLINPKEHTDEVLVTVIQHWAKARIDSPLHLIARLDDAAKQVITVTGLLQGALIAVAKINNQPLTPYAVGAAIALLLALLCSATVVCLPPHDMWAHQLYRDLKCARDDMSLEDQLDGRFKDWCEQVGDAAKRKRVGLTMAMILLTIGLALAVVCLTSSLGVQ